MLVWHSTPCNVIPNSLSTESTRDENILDVAKLDSTVRLGNSHRPAKRPVLGLWTVRYWTLTSESLSTITTASVSSLACFFFTFCGKLQTPRETSHWDDWRQRSHSSISTFLSFAAPLTESKLLSDFKGFPLNNRLAAVLCSSTCFKALHCFRRGHVLHFGDDGVHRVAPNSIKAWLKSPGLSTGTILLASSQNFSTAWLLEVWAPMLQRRDKTLMTFPSTTPVHSP